MKEQIEQKLKNLCPDMDCKVSTDQNELSTVQIAGLTYVLLDTNEPISLLKIRIAKALEDLIQLHVCQLIKLIGDK